MEAKLKSSGPNSYPFNMGPTWENDVLPLIQFIYYWYYNRVQSEGPLKIRENPPNLDWGKEEVDDTAFKIFCIIMAR